MGLPVGKPCGKVGDQSKPCLKAFTWLLIFVCKMCIKDRAEAQGLSGAGVGMSLLSAIGRDDYRLLLA